MALIGGTASTDTLAGTSGADVFTGGAGSDVFVWDASRGTQADAVVDFGATYFGGPITGSQEAPATTSTAMGSVTAWLDRAQTKLTFASQTTGLDLGGQTAATTDNVLAAHFHRAVAGVSGGVVFGFIGAPNNERGTDTVVNAAAGTVSGVWNATEGNNTTLTAQLPNLLNNEIYINFHTPPNPAGEIRGQLIKLDSGLDRIDVSALGVADFNSLVQVMSEVNGSTVISVPWNGLTKSLTLTGVPTARLSAADFVFSTASDFSQFATVGSDAIFGGAANDVINGLSGDDKVVGGAGNDDLSGGDGNDTVVGLSGNDRVAGDGGEDHLFGNLGEDRLFGFAGHDTLRGGQGADSLSGGDGNDLLAGDLGVDSLTGGTGADRFVLRTGSGADIVTDFNPTEGDAIQLAPGTAFTVASSFGVAQVVLASGDSLTLTGVAASSFSSSWVVFV
jgi:Ca2+-binding RTX toxin-like protein